MSIKSLVGRRVTKEVEFLGEKLTIMQMTVGHVEAIRSIAEKLEKAEEGAEKDELEILRFVIRNSVEGGLDLTTEDFKEFPIDALNKLAQDIMSFSGVDKGGN